MENEVGRPKKTVDETFKDWSNWIVEITDLYREGASDVEIKSLISLHCGSISNDLWDRWLKDEDKFSETIKIGRAFSQAWWEKNGRINLENKDFNYTGWYMNMKNRFKWKDRTDVTSDEKPIDTVTVEFMNYKEKK